MDSPAERTGVLLEDYPAVYLGFVADMENWHQNSPYHERQHGGALLPALRRLAPSIRATFILGFVCTEYGFDEVDREGFVLFFDSLSNGLVDASN